MPFSGQLGNQLGDIILAFNVNKYIDSGAGGVTIGGSAPAAAILDQFGHTPTGGFALGGCAVVTFKPERHTYVASGGLSLGRRSFIRFFPRTCQPLVGDAPPILEEDSELFPESIFPWEDEIFLPCIRDNQNVECIQLREVFPFCKIRNDNCSGRGAYLPATTFCQQRYFVASPKQPITPEPEEEEQISMLSLGDIGEPPTEKTIEVNSGDPSLFGVPKLKNNNKKAKRAKPLLLLANLQSARIVKKVEIEDVESLEPFVRPKDEIIVAPRGSGHIKRELGSNNKPKGRNKKINRQREINILEAEVSKADQPIPITAFTISPTKPIERPKDEIIVAPTSLTRKRQPIRGNRPSVKARRLNSQLKKNIQDAEASRRKRSRELT